MKPADQKILVIVDEDPINKTINKSLLKSISVVQEINECQSGMEALSYIIKYKKLDGQRPDIILLNLNKSASIKYKFVDLFNFFNKSRAGSPFFTVLYTPDFFEDLNLGGLPGIKIIEKPYKINVETVPDYFEKDIYNLTLPGFEIVEKPLGNLENKGSN